MSTLSELLFKEELTGREKNELRQRLDLLEQNSLAINDIMTPTGGVTVSGSLKILGDFLMAGSRFFYDGAGNLQFRMIRGSNYTLSDGDMIVNQPATADPFYLLHEANVQKAAMWWDVSDNNVSIENYETGASGVVLVVADASGICTVHRRDTDTEEYLFSVNDGTETVMNQQGRNIDFRIEGDTRANLFKLDAGLEQVSVDGLFNLVEGAELTIASGEVTITNSFHSIDTESDASSDNLDTINGGAQEGNVLVLMAADGTRDVVCKDKTGNLQLAGDFTLDSSRDRITLMFHNSDWVELCRSSNA